MCIQLTDTKRQWDPYSEIESSFKECSNDIGSEYNVLFISNLNTKEPWVIQDSRAPKNGYASEGKLDRKETLGQISLNFFFFFFGHGAAYGEYQVIYLNMDRKRERTGLSRTDFILFAFWPEASEVLMLWFKEVLDQCSMKQYKLWDPLPELAYHP